MTPETNTPELAEIVIRAAEQVPGNFIWEEGSESEAGVVESEAIEFTQYLLKDPAFLALAAKELQGEAVGFKFPRQPYKEGGWTIDVTLLGELSDLADKRSEYAPSMEEIETILLILEENTMRQNEQEGFLCRHYTPPQPPTNSDISSGTDTSKPLQHNEVGATFSATDCINNEVERPQAEVATLQWNVEQFQKQGAREIALQLQFRDAVARMGLVEEGAAPTEAADALTKFSEATKPVKVDVEPVAYGWLDGCGNYAVSTRCPSSVKYPDILIIRSRSHSTSQGAEKGEGNG